MLAYFGYHAVHGRHGAIAYFSLAQRIDDLEDIYAERIQTRQQLEMRVALLRDESLNADMLEERARILLNLGRAGDIVILENSVSDSRF